MFLTRSEFPSSFLDDTGIYNQTIMIKGLFVAGLGPALEELTEEKGNWVFRPKFLETAIRT